ncbi:MAG: VOC family protein [Thioalkalispiraceae bacterium]|jgi:lactoylglutathione lyase
MISINKLDHIGVRVTDFERSVVFYQQFGFAVIREDLNERVMVLRHPNSMELNLLDSAERGDQPMQNVLMDEPVKYPGYTHIAFQVANVTHAAHYLTALGMTLTEGPVEFGDGKTSIFIRDPDRNVIEFTQHPLRHTSRQEVTR